MILSLQRRAHCINFDHRKGSYSLIECEAHQIVSPLLHPNEIMLHERDYDTRDKSRKERLDDCCHIFLRRNYRVILY